MAFLIEVFISALAAKSVLVAVACKIVPREPVIVGGTLALFSGVALFRGYLLVDGASLSHAMGGLFGLCLGLLSVLLPNRTEKPQGRAG